MAALRQRARTRLGSGTGSTTQDGANSKDVLPSPSPRASSGPLFRISWYALLVIVPVRVFFALYMPMPDCDETFNYWEPLHYVTYGRGTRTWEYSPEFALRSFWYLNWNWLWVKLVEILTMQESKVVLFYGVRVILGLTCALCEASLVQAVKGQMGRGVSKLLVLFLAGSSGMSHASVALLPQQFTMCTIMLCFAAWLHGDLRSAVFWMGVSALLGWPFAAVLALPLAVEVVVRYYKQWLLPPIRWGLGTLFFCLVPSMLIDYFYYHKWVVAVVNIAIYNGAPTAAKGANLYGVEPWSFYVVNLFLNFNGAFLLALLSPLVALWLVATSPSKPLKSADNGKPRKPSLGSMAWLYFKISSPMALWLCLMFAMPHKEERFLFVIYPSMALAAAFCLFGLTTAFGSLKSTRLTSTPLKTLFVAAVGGLFLCLSASRSAALVIHYSAPLRVYGHLSEMHEQGTFLDAQARVCVGKEWYRFPSHFFLPESPVPARLEFLKSEFGGQLPKHFDNETTWEIAPHFNDLNQEEPTRYVDVDACDYIIDLELPSQNEERFSMNADFELVYSTPFLDASRSPGIFRAFYVPFVSDQRNAFVPYQLFRRRKQDGCRGVG